MNNNNFANALREFHVLRQQISPRSNGLHFHDQYQLIFVRSGEIVHKIGTKTETICAGEAIIMAPRTEHCIAECHSADMYSAIFQKSFLPQDALEGLLGDYLRLKAQYASEGASKCVLSEENSEIIHTLFDIMLSEYQSHRLFYTTMLQGLLLSTLMIVARTEWEKPEFRGKDVVEEKRKSILSLVDKMPEMMEQPISTEEAARFCMMSRSQFCKFFRDVTGETYADYRTKIRMNAAARMLQQSSHKLETIATACGFQDYSSFYRTFVSTYEISPSEYRRMRSEWQDPSQEY